MASLFAFWTGCSDPPHRGAASPEALTAAIKEGYESGNSKKVFSYFYVEGSPQEVQDLMKEIIHGYGSGELKVQRLDFIPFSDYISVTEEMPGHINGK
jgi:hypothetical protein